METFGKGFKRTQIHIDLIIKFNGDQSRLYLALPMMQREVEVMFRVVCRRVANIRDDILMIISCFFYVSV